MDTDLFMECEEEELEPWQLVDDDVEEDDANITGCHDNINHAVFTPPPWTTCLSASSTTPTAAQQTVLSPGSSSVGTIKTQLTTTMSSPVRPDPSGPLVASASMPAVASLVPAGIAQGQQLFLTQTSGLGTILLPAGKPGAHSAINQPIFLTSQRFPGPNVLPAQNTINPVGFVLNMPNQSFQPITLLAGSPGARVLRPIVGVPQVVPRAQLESWVRPQIQIHQFRPLTAPVQPRTTMAIHIPTVKLPATLTIQKSQAGNASKVTLAATNTTDTLSTATTTTLHLNSQLVRKSSQQMKCPRCGNLFEMQAALQGHMCFCCPDIVNTTKASSTMVNTLEPPSSVVSTNASLAPVHTLTPLKLVMNVEDFYYGTKAGYDVLTFNARRTPLQCQVCSMTLIDNVGMMSHMWLHSNQGSQSSLSNALKSCQYCFRQFCSTKKWKCHLDKVHSPIEYPCICKICEWVFESEHVFLNHMKATHKPGEMPYVCQVCDYSSSFFSHLYNHFLLHHRSTVFLLCVYCLKVFRNEKTYQQHFLRHQNHKAFHCNKCRLQFILLKNLIEHKMHHHQTVCKPKVLEGLPSGTKVTIRAQSANMIQVAKRNPLMPIDPDLPPPFPNQEPAHHYSALKPLKLKSPKQLPLSIESQQVKGSPHKRKSVSKMLDMLTKFQNKRGMDLQDQRCMECGTGVASFPNHYPTSVRCLLCAYKTCCSRSYADHMIHNHVPQTNPKSFPLHKQPPPCYFKLQCCGCDFSSPTGDLMAKHLVQNPDHKKSMCNRRKYVEFDIGFCQDEELEKNEDLQKPAWALIEHWTKPLPLGVDGAITKTPHFTVSSGPQHSLPKNGDAIDYFNLLFPKDLIELIAYETNAHVKTCQFLGWHDLNWIPVTTHDIQVFIGLSILMGLENLAELPHYWSWKHNARCDTFLRAMTFNRFQQISDNICMGSLLTEEYSGNTRSDELNIFNPMHNILGPAMWNAYVPNQCLSIDRALLPSHEDKTVSTKGDSKAPPQVWLLCDSKSGYCHRFLIQLKKEKDIDLGFSVVSPLVEGLQEKHHQVFLASSLTSVPLMQKLLDQGIYSSSSFPIQSPIIPKEIWEQGSLEKPGDFLQRQYGPLLATRWMDTKEMGCLSTNANPGEPDTVWRKSQTKVGELSPINRPLAFRLLQENMRGVDICKQLLACNPLGGLQQNKYWKSIFSFLVNLSIVNAFIVLRESRKDNPPLWVQDGLFTQAAFRKRLGHQLLKSFRKRSWVSSAFKVDTIQKKRRLRVQVKTDTSSLQLDGDGIKTVRHRMVRLTPRTRRCRACHLKNLRHESVYGCIVCKVNLCKQTSCFWEYHGFPPNTQGNVKIGFVEDETSRSSQWVTSDQEDETDLGMAPVEEMDSDTDEDDEDDDDDDDDDSQFEVIHEESHQRESKPPLLLPVPAEHPDETPTELPVVKDDLEVLSARQLRIALFALCSGISYASADFSTPTQLIQKWLADKKRQLMHDSKEQDRGKATESLVEWVLSQHEQGHPVNERNLFLKASEIHKQGGFSGFFRISYDWAVGFMMQHKLGLRSPGRTPTVSLSLPQSMENNISDFTKFTSKVIHVHKIPHTAIAAMDELSVFVDFKWLADEIKVEKHGALRMVGSGDPLFTIYLAALADGTLLPTLVLTKEPLPNSVPSNHVILVAKQECKTREDYLDLWISRVWQKHMPVKSHSNKALLILDGHCEHVSDQILGTLSDTCTLPAVIPTGCTSRIQPLEMCVRPILQRFLLARWAQLATKDGLTRASCKDVVQLLTNWLAEALFCLANQPELVRKSFLITGLLSEQKDHETIQSLENAQSVLLTTLTGVLVGPELAAFEQED